MKFRQKEYAGKTEAGSKVVNLLKKHPVLGVSAASLGVSSANLAVNTSRHKEARKYQEDQLKAMDKLTNVLGKVDKSLNTANNIAKERAEQPKRFKLFSIETGGFKRFRIKETVGSRDENLKTWLTKVAENSIFYNPEEEEINFIQDLESEPVKRETTIIGGTENSNYVSKEVQISSNPEGLVYDENSNPNEYTISVLSKNNVLVLYIDKPNTEELKTLNNILDKYCESNKESDYISEKISKNVYLVQVKLTPKYTSTLAKDFLECNIRFNVLS